MDRDLLYAGQIGLVENTLNAFKSAMVAIGIATEAILGPSTQCFGLIPTALSNTAVSGSPFAISIGRGAIFSYQETDGTAYGVLGTDTTTNILKTGINLNATNVGIASGAPGTAGQSVNYLVSAQFQEQDTNSVNLPFYNAGGTPTISVENATRTQRVVFQVTGGAAAATGSQLTPATPAGWTPLYVVTVTNGQTAVAIGNIAQASGAPFLDPQDLGNGIQTGRLLNVQYFKTPGTSTYGAFPGTNSVIVEVIGGGASGAGCVATGASQVSAGGGGGAGGYAKKRFTSGFNGLVVTVGAGGAATAAGAAGNAGGSSSFGSSFGAGGGNAQNYPGPVGGSTAAFPNGGAAGGSGFNGDINATGGSGNYAIYASPSTSGAGGASFLGAGAAPITTTGNGMAGTSPGAGGSGGVQSAASSSALSGGAGASGIVIVYEYA
jgi:hypothetical protein